MTQPTVGVLLFVAYRAMEQRILAAVRASGCEDLTLAQARVIARIGEDGTRLTDLAEMSQVTKQTAGSLVDNLEAGGYVERRPDPLDGRARLVLIAPRGSRAREVADATEQQIYAEWREHLGPEAFSALESTLGRLRTISDPYADLDPQPMSPLPRDGATHTG